MSGPGFDAVRSVEGLTFVGVGALSLLSEALWENRFFGLCVTLGRFGGRPRPCLVGCGREMTQELLPVSVTGK